MVGDGQLKHWHLVAQGQLQGLGICRTLQTVMLHTDWLLFSFCYKKDLVTGIFHAVFLCSFKNICFPSSIQDQVH